jgi:tetratricopeptide (TPR) repeat protein
MKLPAGLTAVLSLAFLLARANPAAAAEDVSIDRLLNKLPAPEKIAQARRIDSDPAMRDPLARDLGNALSRNDSRRALVLSRRLAERYPKSALAHFVRGTLATGAHRFPEASAALQQAIKIQPKFFMAYLQLGVVELSQGHFAAAMPYFQKAVKLEPKMPFGWIFLSGCSENLGRQQESIDYARRATTIAPEFQTAWLQLARAEKLAGHKSEAKRAENRAQQLARQYRRR